MDELKYLFTLTLQLGCGLVVESLYSGIRRSRIKEKIQTNFDEFLDLDGHITYWFQNLGI